MWEEGLVFFVSKNGRRGKIEPASGGTVEFEEGVVIGPKPLEQQRVCFLRKRSDGSTAARVILQLRDCDSAELAWQLGDTFRSALGDARLSTDAEAEVLRLSRARARLIQQKLINNDVAPAPVVKSRRKLAEAAMALMAIEAADAAGDGEISVEDLRNVLRRQRPRLPR